MNRIAMYSVLGWLSGSAFILASPLGQSSLDPIFEIAKQVPSLAVLVYLVVQFLKSMKERDAQLGELHHEAMGEWEKTRQVIDKSTDALASNTSAMDRFSRSVERMEAHNKGDAR